MRGASRDGRGRWVKTSQPASSSASSAASPPRAKRPTAARSARRSAPAGAARPASSPRARSASNRSKRVSGSFGASSTVDVVAAAVLGRQVDPPELEVARDVLEEVDELEPGADVVGGAHELLVVRPPEQPEHEPADRVGRVVAVPLHLVPGRRTRACAGRSGCTRSGAGTARAEGRTRGSSAGAVA